MRNPFKPKYGWRAEWAGIRGAKWWAALFLIVAYWYLNDFANFGYLMIRVPGSEYAVYYFGIDPFLLGVTAAVVLGKFNKVANQARLDYAALKRSATYYPPPPLLPNQNYGTETFNVEPEVHPPADEGNPHEDTQANR